MPSELEILQAQLQEERRRREEAEREANNERLLRQEEQRRREEEQRRREEEQRRREEEQRKRREEQEHYERRTGKTALPEFLHACHVHLFSGLTIQPDKSKSTQGGPENAEKKVRPRRILPWTDFANHQTAIWDTIMSSDFVFEKHFTSIHTLEEFGEELRQKQLSSELDLHYFVGVTLENRVTSIINRLGQDAVMRQKLRLRGPISFENHANMFSAAELREDMQGLAISDPPPQHQSPRQRYQPVPARNRSQSPARSSKGSYPRADIFCAYSLGDETGGNFQQWPAFVIELKAPHKLTLGHIYTGLKETDVDDIVQVYPDEDDTRKYQRLVAAVITQAFSYMVTSGLETGSICTGEAFIFLRIPEDDPSQVYYSLAVPHGDVGRDTGWTAELDQANRLHLTAVGQMLAFTLRAIQLSPRSSRWRRDALAQLPRWEVTVEDLEDAIPKDSVPSSEYRPPHGEGSSPPVQSPISRRLRRKLVSAYCATGVVLPRTPDDSDEGDEGDHLVGQKIETPSRAQPSSRRAQEDTGEKATDSKTQQSKQQNASKQCHVQQDLGPYCTSLCLKGLTERGMLDPQCPNVHSHGQGRHAIDLRKFRSLVRELLRDHIEYCEELYIRGATGVLYRIRLPQWGYTVIAKGTSWSRRRHLYHEADVYKQLRPIQGQYCPLYLGMYKVEGELWYAGDVLVTHLMVMSYEGQSLLRQRCPSDHIDQALRGLRAIHDYGVLHRDIALRNILYNAQLKRVVWHDFDRSIITRSKQGQGKGRRGTTDDNRAFMREMNAVTMVMVCEPSYVALKPIAKKGAECTKGLAVHDMQVGSIVDM